MKVNEDNYDSISRDHGHLAHQIAGYCARHKNVVWERGYQDDPDYDGTEVIAVSDEIKSLLDEHDKTQEALTKFALAQQEKINESN